MTKFRHRCRRHGGHEPSAGSGVLLPVWCGQQDSCSRVECASFVSIIPASRVLESDGTRKHHTRRLFLLEGSISLGRTTLPRGYRAGKCYGYLTQARNPQTILYRWSAEEQHSAMVILNA